MTPFASHHCSRCTTDIERLTEAMFVEVVRAVKDHLDRVTRGPLELPRGAM